MDTPRTIDEVLDHAAEDDGERPCLVTPAETRTFASLRDSVLAVAGGLAAEGLAPGDRVVLRLPPGVGFVVAFLAVVRAGGLAVPLDPRTRPDALARLREACSPRLEIADDETLARLAATVASGTRSAAEPDAPVSISYTSGSTGAPKGVVHTHRSWLAGAAFTVDHLGLDRDGMMLVPLPLHHAYAFRHVLAGLLARRRTLVTAGLLDALERVEDDRPDGLLLVPDTAAMLARTFRAIARRCAPFVRTVSVGTAATSVELLRSLRELFPDAAVHLPYGLTEARVGFLDLDDDPACRRLVAIDPTLDVRLVAGEIVVRGDALMRGYYGASDAEIAALREHGFHTGDLGRLAGDGGIALVGRLDDVIKVTGRKVVPQEVESVIDRHPDVVESAVRAAPSDTDTVPLEALVVARDAPPDPAALAEHCRAHLEAYKIPTTFRFVSGLPRNAMGKIVRVPPAVVFDLDGVLFDSYRAHFESWRRLAEELGQTLTEERFRPYFGTSGSRLIGVLYGDAAGSPAEAARLYERKKTLFLEIAAEGCPPVDGAVELVDALDEAGFRLGIATSGPRANIAAAQVGLDRAERFGASVGREDVPHTKPDPALYLAAARRLAVPPSGCVAIEDSPVGIVAARRAGMRVVALLTSVRAADELAEADLIVESLRELSPTRIGALLEG